MRGIFSRGYLDGTTENIGVVQGDAIRNITGQFAANAGSDAVGAFYVRQNGSQGYGSSPRGFPYMGFDASRVVPTADENRPKNLAFHYFIKF